MTRILLATGNVHKVEELRQLLGADIDVVTPADLGIDIEVEENGDSFAANAVLKAEAYLKASGELCVADDSGLCVDALQGAPGIHSARFAQMHDAGQGDADNRAYLLKMLADVDDAERSARFCCALAVAEPNQPTHIFAGESEGRIIHQQRGESGFGYDSLFESYDGRTFAELSSEEKQARSHRGMAMQAAEDLLRERCGRTE